MKHLLLRLALDLALLFLGLSTLLTLVLIGVWHYTKHRRPPGENKPCLPGDACPDEKTGESVDGLPPTENEIELVARIHQLMLDRQVYRDSTLTLDSLAQHLGVNRETVSRSINRTTGKNFSRFLNGYRIGEAVRLLSLACHQTVNFDDLAEQVGFNNRTSFHRVFKQITGLPPKQFKNKG